MNTIVYAENGIYAGWPANHGAWQWGDEFLVGFLRGKYKSKSMHNIVEPFEKVLGRSLDGGETWNIEIPNVDFECHGNQIPSEAPEFDLEKSIIRVCGVYDHGGDECYEPGGFYLSHDRGHVWSGPYRFSGLEHQYEYSKDFINTSRTRVLGNMVFMSYADRLMWGSDSTFCAIHDGKNFKFIASVIDDGDRAVMPAVAKVGSRIIVVMRRRGKGKMEGWIDACISENDGYSWRKAGQVGITGGRNGNPPALIALTDGRLVCCYANRDFGSIVASVSSDGGETWSNQLVRDGDGDFLDIGYPQLFMRADGVPVCVYYWSDRQRRHQHIVGTTLECVL